MRRPRTHRLTGSGPRLLAAAAIAALGAVGVVTVASASGAGANSNGSSAVAGPHGALAPTPTSCVVGIICLPTSLLPTATPTLPPLHLLLDVIAAGAVILAIGKSWSTADVD